jgi:hypothetical protein
MTAQWRGRSGTLRGLLFACIAAVLASIFGWWLHDLENGLSSAPIDRNRDKSALARNQENSRPPVTDSQQLAEIRQALQEERDKVERLAGDLAAARRERGSQTVALKTADTEQVAETQQLMATRRELQEKLNALVGDLAAAREEGRAQAAALNRSAERTAEQLTEVRSTLQKERDRAEAIERDLAAARREIDSQAEALKQQALEKSKAQREALAKEPGEPTGSPKADVAAARLSPIVAPPSPEERLMTRARQLIQQGNISAARNMLERAVEGGNARALFALAETYDPNMLSTWGTVGIQGDVAKARELYGRALAGGVEDANARLKAMAQNSR